MKVRDLECFQTNSDVLSMDQDVTVLEAAQKMSELNIGAVMVTQGDMMCGIATERDFMKKVIAQKLDPDSTRLADVMTTEVETAFPDDDVEDCRQKMEKGKFRHLPIISNMGQVIAMISQRDVSRIKD